MKCGINETGGEMVAVTAENVLEIPVGVAALPPQLLPLVLSLLS
jgi:hypothetical protein